MPIDFEKNSKVNHLLVFRRQESGRIMLDLGPVFVKSLAVPPGNRSLQDLQVLYYTLSAIEALQSLTDSTLRTLCKIVRYASFPANHVLYQ